MFRILLSATILLGVASMLAIAHAATPSELKPVKVDLPDSDKMFPDGLKWTPNLGPGMAEVKV
jgi:hypothetical protein